MTIDISKLWDYSKPELSEERFCTALATASGDDILILKTQIARTYGMRGDFPQARKILAGIEPHMMTAGFEAKAHYHLELGRTYSSSTHSPESQTNEVRELARSTFIHAFEVAQEGKLDDLAIDTLHMMTCVDTAPEDQIEWNQKALELMESSLQPGARRWEGMLRNNSGYALHQLGRYEDALQEFNLALAARVREGDPRTIRIAHWMIAWTLRAMNRLNDALEIQLRLEKECDQAGEPDPYVFEELENLYRALNNTERAVHYAARREESE